jgi:hypothetical protein
LTAETSVFEVRIIISPTCSKKDFAGAKLFPMDAALFMAPPVDRLASDEPAS